MTERRCRLVEDLPFRGLEPKTQPGDVDAVKPLAQDDQRSPDQITAAHMRQDCLDRLNEKQVAELPCCLHL